MLKGTKKVNELTRNNVNALTEEGLPMKRKKEETIQSTMRLPKRLWKILNRVAASKRLSMQQAVERAIAEYCFSYGTLGEREWIASQFELKQLFTSHERERGKLT